VVEILVRGEKEAIDIVVVDMVVVFRVALMDMEMDIYPLCSVPHPLRMGTAQQHNTTQMGVKQFNCETCYFDKLL
jgi:hypothetical protein